MYKEMKRKKRHVVALDVLEIWFIWEGRKESGDGVKDFKVLHMARLAKPRSASCQQTSFCLILQNLLVLLIFLPQYLNPSFSHVSLNSFNPLSHDLLWRHHERILIDIEFGQTRELTKSVGQSVNLIVAQVKFFEVCEVGYFVRKLSQLLLRLRISRLFSFPIEFGRPWSSLKRASKRRKDFISPIDVGSERILLRLIDSRLRFFISNPMFVG
ncbi:alpha/beta-Hydrolases superfamily protein, partial [Striga asiatica]